MNYAFAKLVLEQSRWDGSIEYLLDIFDKYT